MNAEEGVEKREPSYTVGGNVNWFPLWRTVWRFLTKLKIELPSDPSIPLLGIHLEKTIIRKDTCTPMFIAALFTIPRTRKPPKYPSTDEGMISDECAHLGTLSTYFDEFQQMHATT